LLLRVARDELGDVVEGEVAADERLVLERLRCAVGVGRGGGGGGGSHVQERGSVGAQARGTTSRRGAACRPRAPALVRSFALTLIDSGFGGGERLVLDRRRAGGEARV